MGSEIGLRRARAADLPVWVVPLVVGFAQAGGSTGAERAHTGPVDLDGPGYGLLWLTAAALLARRRHPVATLAVTAVTTLAYALHGYVLGPSFLGLATALVSAVATGHRRAAWITAAVVVTGYPAGALLAGGPLVNVDRPTLSGSLPALGWALLVLTFAEVVRFRSERAAQVRRTLEESARRRAGEERLRIARELHDVLAHNISMINVQAGVALHLMDERPEQARTALAAIKEASREALTEMRSVIEVLRQDGDAAPRTPTAGLDRLEDLLAQARAAGLAVHLETEGQQRPLPAGADLAAFRIVQESLTNVARHSGASAVTVRIGYAPDDVSVQIDDNGHGPGHNAAETAEMAGNGIPGMRERAAALGGELAAGPRPGGGFRVRARLPTGGD